MSDYDSGYMDGKAVMYERIAELEQELAIGVSVIRDYEERIAELEQVLIKLESRTSGQCTLESLNRICRVALGKEVDNG